MACSPFCPVVNRGKENGGGTKMKYKELDETLIEMQKDVRAAHRLPIVPFDKKFGKLEKEFMNALKPYFKKCKNEPDIVKKLYPLDISGTELEAAFNKLHKRYEKLYRITGKPSNPPGTGVGPSIYIEEPGGKPYVMVRG